MRHAAGMNTLDIWYDHLEVGRILDELAQGQRDDELSKQDVRETKRQIAKARTRDSLRVLARRTEETDGVLRIVAEPPLVVPIEELVEPGSAWEAAETTVKSLLSTYRATLSHDRHPVEEFRYVHCARKVVGVGSVGTRCYLLLLVGRDDRDPLFLQAKEAQASVLAQFLAPSEYEKRRRRRRSSPSSSRRANTRTTANGWSWASG
jgi:uncharacterized protein (DUF2252 family)